MNNFIPRTPFFRLLLPVILGIVVYQYLEISVLILSVLFVFSCILIAFSFFIRRSNLQYRFRWLFGSGISVFLFVLAYFSCINTDRQNSFEHLGKEGVFLVELISTPIEKARSYQLEVRILQFSDSVSTEVSQGKAYIYFPKDSAIANLQFGDRLLVETEFNPPSGVQNPEGFDYATYLKRRGIGATTFVQSDSWEKVGRNPRISIRALAHRCQHYFLNIFRKFDFRQEDFAVLAALTFGYSDELEPSTYASYSAAGAIHVLSVSGLHVGIIYAVLIFLFGFLNKTQKQRNFRIAFILFFLWSYAFITGLSPPTFRATLMFSCVVLGGLFERKSMTYNTICMSAFFILLINPEFLFYVGFQFSYSAVLSIIYFQPRINKLLTFKNKVAKWVWDLFSVSTAAQIGTIPFALYYFQMFPNYFLLSNMVVVPIATFVLYLGVALIVVASVPIVSTAVVFALKVLLWIMNFTVVLVENLPFAVSTIAINEMQAILIFVLLFAFGYYSFSRKYNALVIGFCCIIAIFGINIQIKHNTLNSQKMIVYSGNRNTHINFIDGTKNLIYTSDYTELRRIASSFWNNHKLKNPKFINEHDAFVDGSFSFNGLRIFILEEDFSRNYTADEPLKVDYLIIGNGLRPRIERLLECIEPKNIITDRTITAWYTNRIREVAEERDINFHSTRLNGAYVRKIN